MHSVLSVGARVVIAALLSVVIHSVLLSPNSGYAWTAPVPVNSQAASDSADDTQVSVCSNGQGGFVSVWQTNAAAGGGVGDFDIAVSGSSDGGATWTPEVPLNSGAGSDTSNEMTPRIACGAAGSLVAVWVSGSAGSDPDIHFARSTSGGFDWSASAPLNTDAATDLRGDMEPAVYGDRMGNWVVVWTGVAGGADAELYFSRSTDNAQTWSPPAILNTNHATDNLLDTQVSVAGDGTGVWIATWAAMAGNLGCEPAAHGNLLMSRSLDNGQTWSAPGVVHDSGDCQAGDPCVCPHSERPQVVTDANGTWMIIWTQVGIKFTYVGVQPNPDVMVARSTDGGVTWDPKVTVTSTDNHSGSPRVVSVARNTWVAAFGGIGQWFARSTDNGATWGVVQMADLWMGSPGEPLDLAVHGDRLVCLWSSVGPYSAPTPDSDVYCAGALNSALVCNLKATKTGPAGPLPVQSPVAYDVTVRNLGPDAAAGVFIVDTLPAGMQYAGATASQGTVGVDNGTITVQAGNLPAGASVSFHVDATATAAGVQVNKVFAASESAEAHWPDNEATVATDVRNVTDLSITKTAGADTITTAQTVIYQIVVANPGEFIARRVVVTDLMPEGATVIGTTASQGLVAEEDGTVVLDAGTMDAGSTVTLGIEVRMSRTGSLTNMAHVQSMEYDPVLANNDARAPIWVLPTGGNLADLAGRWTGVSATFQPDRRGGSWTLRGTVVVRNIGFVKTGSSRVAFYLSADSVVDASDVPLGYARALALDPGQTRALQFQRRSRTDPEGKFLLAVLDSPNRITEESEDNNLAVSVPAFMAP